MVSTYTTYLGPQMDVSKVIVEMVSETVQNIINWFKNWADNVNWPPKIDSKADVSSGGQLTLSTQLLNPIYLVTLPTDAAQQFL